MELLVATLAQMAVSKDVDGPARLRFISETVRNAPGLVNVRMFGNKGRFEHDVADRARIRGCVRVVHK